MERESDRIKFVTMAPNVGPFQSSEGQGQERRETGYCSERQSATEECPSVRVFEECPVSERGSDTERKSRPLGRRDRYITFRKDRNRHGSGCTSSDEEVSTDDGRRTRRKQEYRQSGAATRQSDGVTRQHGGATGPSDGSNRPSDGAPLCDGSSTRPSGGSRYSYDGSHGSRRAGPDYPSRGTSLTRMKVTGRGDPSPDHHAPGWSNSESSRRPVLPTLKLGSYDGSTCLMTFLAKFENCIDYYGWSSKEQLCHLRASLEGAAGQVLWDAGKQSSVDEVIHLLKSRFGTTNEEERYRSELRSRRRRRGESLQSVYRDVRRLMALAFPGQSGSLWEVMARDAFVDALSDPNLRCRVLERDPSTLEEALKIASRLEALSRSVADLDYEDVWDESGRRRNRQGRSAASANDESELRQLIGELREERRSMRQQMDSFCRRQQEEVEGFRRSIKDEVAGAADRLAEHMSMSHLSSPARRFGERPSGTEAPDSRSTGTAEVSRAVDVPTTTRRRQDDRCHRCRQPGHWKKDCPQNPARLRGVVTRNSGMKAYLEVNVAGHRTVCLLDSGCELSMLPRRYVPNTDLKPTDISMYAANGTNIPVVGSVCISFEAGGIPVSTTFLVSEAVDEPMLGLDWLTENQCTWNYAKGILSIGGVDVQLQAGPRRAAVRRVYVAEEVTVPAGMVVDVPVALAWTSYESGVNSTEWVLEPKQIAPGLILARCMLPAAEVATGVSVMNMSGAPRKLNADTCLGGGVPVEVIPRRIIEENHGQHFSSQDSSRQSDGVTGPSDGVHAQSDGSPRPGGGAPVQCDGSCRSCDATAAEASKCFGSRAGMEEAHVPPTIPNDHLLPLLHELKETLSDTEFEATSKLVHDFADVFSRSEFDIGRTEALPHRIDTGNNRPIKQPLRRHPKVHEDFIDEQVEKMLAAKVIEPCASPWASNVVLAKKSDGTLRFCVDYRRLNDCTYKDSFPLPHIDSCLDALGGSSYFSTMDLRSGFWQVAIDERDEDKTAFITRKGQFRFKVLSFGLANSPVVFQRLMSMVLAGLAWQTCLVYIDDIIVVGKTFEEHLHNVAQVLQRLREAGLKLKPSKCKLFRTRVKFLGHVVSGEGTEPDPEKVACIVDWPVPRNVSELRSFLGLASYYQSFVWQFSITARPLYLLTRKGQKFDWGQEQQTAFETLKNRLSTAPTLALPLSEGHFVLDVDASGHGAGAVLHQHQNGVLRVIAYACRLFNHAERAYCTTRQELAAVVFGLKKFKQYLLGRRTIIRSDHAALSFLKRSKEPVAQQARWLDFIEQFDLKIEHRAGSSHRAADALSRRPCDEGQLCPQCEKRRIGTVGGQAMYWQAAVVREVGQAKVITRSQARDTLQVPGQDDGSSRQSGAATRQSDGVTRQHGGATGPSDGAPLCDGSTRPSGGSRYSYDGSFRHSGGSFRPSGGAFGQADGLSPLADAATSERPELENELHGELMQHERHVTTPIPMVCPEGNQLLGWTSEDLISFQRSDETLGKVAVWLKQQAKPPWEETLSHDSELRAYWLQWDSLELRDGLVYRRFETPDGICKYLQMAMPRRIRAPFLEFLHCKVAGHLGMRKTLDHVQRRAYWPSWRVDTKLFCKCCKPCGEFHRGNAPRQAGLKPLRVGLPMDCLHVDLTGPHTSSQGYTYILTACDSFTRYVVAAPLRNKTAFAAAKILVSEVILKFGVPRSILSDLGREFQNELWDEICKLLGTVRLRTTAYNPSTNGKIERWHRSLNAMMAKVVDFKQKRWVEFLPFITAAYNGTIHDSTSFSPNFLFFGRELTSPLDIVLGLPHEEPSSVNDYALHVRDLLAEANALVRSHTGQKAADMKRAYDRVVKPVMFNEGDQVMYFYPRKYKGRSPKWSRFYVGPYTVIKRVNDVNYVIRLNGRSKPIIVHVNKLKPQFEFSSCG